MAITDRLSKKEKKYLKSVYYDPANQGSLGTAEALYKKTKADGIYNFTLPEIKLFLSSVDTYTVFKKPKKSRIKTARWISPGLDEIWQSDLIHMDRYASDNNGFIAICIVLDIFSRYMWYAKLKSTSADDLIDAFKKILDQASPRKCKALCSDAGSNYTSKKFKKFLMENDIKQIVLVPPSHSNYAEAAIKYIQGRINKLFYHNQDKKWEPYISDIIKTKNSSYHHGLKFFPDKVTKKNEMKIFFKQYLPPDKPVRKYVRKDFTGRLMPMTLKLGDKVRIVSIRGHFAHGYQQRWSEEVYIIYKKYFRGSEPIYNLVDSLGEKILGGFKTHELQKVVLPKNPIYKIAKILSYKTIKKKRYALVSWYGYSEKHNSYVLSSSIKDYSKVK